MAEFEILGDYLLEAGIISEQELDLICLVAPMHVDTLNKVLEQRTGKKDLYELTGLNKD